MTTSVVSAGVKAFEKKFQYLKLFVDADTGERGPGLLGPTGLTRATHSDEPELSRRENRFWQNLGEIGRSIVLRKDRVGQIEHDCTKPHSPVY